MTREEQKYVDIVAQLGCVICRNLRLGPTPAEIHHPLRNGRRIGHHYILPLCTLHHRGGVNNAQHVSRHPYHKEFERRYGTEEQLHQQTMTDVIKFQATTGRGTLTA